LQIPRRARWRSRRKAKWDVSAWAVYERSSRRACFSVRAYRAVTRGSAYSFDELCLSRVRAKSHSSRTRLASSSSRERRSRSSMLPSLSAGTFECGRPQIVFERGIGIVVVIEPKLCRKFRVGVPPRGGAYFDFLKVPFFVNAEVCTIHRQTRSPTAWQTPQSGFSQLWADCRW